MTTINNTHVTIDTVTPSLQLGQIMLSADRRDTKETKLTDAERIRRAVLPATVWGEVAATHNGDTAPALGELLRATLKTIACARLRDYLSEQPLARTVDLALFTVPALLTWHGEEAGSRGSITFTREQVEAWYPTSDLYRRASAKGAAVQKLVGDRLAALAARKHGLTKPEEATKLSAMLAEDAAAPLVTELLLRLDHIFKTLSERRTVSLDALENL